MPVPMQGWQSGTSTTLTGAIEAVQAVQMCLQQALQAARGEQTLGHQPLHKQAMK